LIVDRFLKVEQLLTWLAIGFNKMEQMQKYFRKRKCDLGYDTGYAVRVSYLFLRKML